MSPWLSDLLMRSQTDERLVALARLGHERAFTLIVERYRRELLGYARRLDDQRAEDLVQQSFLSAFAALQAGTEVRHLRGWLFQILRNLATRPAGPATLSLESSAGTCGATESAHDAAERRLLAVEALAALAELPARQHDALIRSAVQGQSRTEIASIMGLSEAAVRQLVHRARSALRAGMTAITPLPVARWFSGGLGGFAGRLTEISAGAGAASAGGIVLKVSTLVATGVIATGVVTVVVHHHSQLAPRHLGAPRAVAAATRPPARIAAHSGASGSTAFAGVAVLPSVERRRGLAKAISGGNAGGHEDGGHDARTGASGRGDSSGNGRGDSGSGGGSGGGSDSTKGGSGSGTSSSGGATSGSSGMTAGGVSGSSGSTSSSDGGSSQLASAASTDGGGSSRSGGSSGSSGSSGTSGSSGSSGSSDGGATTTTTTTDGGGGTGTTTTDGGGTSGGSTSSGGGPGPSTDTGTSGGSGSPGSSDGSGSATSSGGM